MLALLVAWNATSIRPALAVDCSAEQTIFVKAFGVTTANGVRSINFVRNRDLNPNCTGSVDAEAHSTAHMRNTSYDKWAEVGWHEDWQGAGHQHNAFWEVGYGDTVICDLGCGPLIGCCDWTKFKVLNVPGTSKWTFHLDYGANGNFVQIGPPGGQTAFFVNGIPMAETGRRGGSLTGALDHHKDLIYNSSPSDPPIWAAWPDTILSGDNITGWHYRGIADDEYEVIKD